MTPSDEVPLGGLDVANGGSGQKRTRSPPSQRQHHQEQQQQQQQQQQHPVWSEEQHPVWFEEQQQKSTQERRERERDRNLYLFFACSASDNKAIEMCQIQICPTVPAKMLGNVNFFLSFKEC
jgi:hypothetical protein